MIKSNLKKIIFFPFILFITFSVSAQNTISEEQRLAWYKSTRFGMFIHWGLYSQIGYNEWAMSRFQVPYTKYSQLAGTFNPVKFNPDDWVILAKEAGMQYMVFTTKHHEGFCMYDTRYTDYDIMQASPYKKDIVKMLDDACIRQQMPLGFYYSNLDWYHPDYLPRAAWDTRPESAADVERYKAYMYNQLEELQTKYHPSIMWFDGEWEKTIDSVSALKMSGMMLKNNPKLVYNDRLYKRGSSIGDFRTPESYIPSTGMKKKDGSADVWEVCHTIGADLWGDTWGYSPFLENFHSTRHLLRMLSDIVSKGGRLLLNIGPTPEGEIQPEFQIRLKEMGAWLKRYGDCIYGADASVFDKLPFYGRSTTKGNIVYLHVFLFPENRMLYVPLLKNNIKKIYALDEPGKTLSYKQKDGQICIQLPEKQPDINISVIAVEVEGKPEVARYEPAFTSVADTIVLPSEYGVKHPIEKNGFETVQHYQTTMIKGWEDTTEYLTWNFTLNKQGRYHVHVFASPLNQNKNNTVTMLEIDKKPLEGVFVVNKKLRYTSPTDVDMGIWSLQPGHHEVKLKVKKKGNEGLRLEKIVFLPEKK